MQMLAHCIIGSPGIVRAVLARCCRNSGGRIDGRLRYDHSARLHSYVFAIRSERLICREVQVNLTYRWF